ncbi:hypothetical protein SEA_GOIB_28 [Gordonia phage Goib]|uniref:Minor tail protein n=2 Tax=Vendettavirus vendetta TaxID=2049886 RepID=A0A160DD26_9CAUD|nr:minor tail protein [Gordonia phage Vendetta]YP_009275382.1 minor tail protein [Gordonia phage Splinter]ANA85575.1 minor tail protein [Gordonia phage Vendetta]ANA85654.1 minor tail protein [Gordonia phage Splinter]WNO25772.1 hypothetical protein SEA_GOIB_28 [Gordonia phage Goib]
MATIIRFRRNTAAEAAASNPVLRAGEPGFAVDTNTLKVGDGVRAWNDLPDVGVDAGGLVVVWDELSQDVRDRISARLTRDQADALYASVARVSGIEADVSALSGAVDQLGTDVAGKLDRSSTPNQVYGTNSAGDQNMWRVSSSATGTTLALRGSGGVLSIGPGTDEGHAVTKGQMDAGDAGKVDKTNLTVRLYGTDGAGNQQALVWGQSAATPNTIPRRTSTGATFTGDATDPAHAVTKGQLDAGLATKANASALSGKADLVGGVIPVSQLPRVQIGETFTASSEAAMLALDAQPGDVAIRTDIDTVYMMKAQNPAALSSWFDLSSAAQGGVVSVNGQTGTVFLGKSDVGLDRVDNTPDVDKPVSGPVAQALTGKVGTGDARLSNERVPVNGSVEWDKLGPVLQSDFAGVESVARSALQGEVVASLPANPVPGRVYLVTG